MQMNLGSIFRMLVFLLFPLVVALITLFWMSNSVDMVSEKENFDSQQSALTKANPDAN